MLMPVSNSNRPLVRFWLPHGVRPWPVNDCLSRALTSHLAFSRCAVTWIALKLQLLVCLIDTDGNGYISCNELNDLFKAACLPLPGYRVREITENLMATGDLDKDGKISFDEFIKVSLTQNTRRCIWILELQFEKYPEIRSHPPCFNLAYSFLCGFLDHRLRF